MHLLVDAVEVLGSSVNVVVLYSVSFELLGDLGYDLSHEGFSFGTLSRDKTYEFVVTVMVKISETKILEFPLDLKYSEPLCERHVYIECLPGLLDLLLGSLILHRTHIVKTVRELYQDDSDILRHGYEHLSNIRCLYLFLRNICDLIELCNSFYEERYGGAEYLFEHLGIDFCIFYSVMQERCCERFGIDLELCKDLGRGDRVDDIHLSRLSLLRYMSLICEMVCPFDQRLLGIELLCRQMSM